MKPRARVTAALATVVALAASAFAVQQMMPASAAAPASTALVAAAPDNLVQGVVVDQHGTPVDDVLVEAIAADGTTEASSFTYASRWENGPQHGYFFVPVKRGEYTLVLSKAGYKTVEYDAGRITKRVKKISMGEIEIQKVAAPTTTAAELVKPTITTRDLGAVTVTVESKAEGKLVGDVEVREGRRVVGEATIVKKAKGTVVVTLDKLPKGSHQLTAYFLGSADFKPSSSKPVTLQVVKKKS